MVKIHLVEANPGHAGRPGQVGGSAKRLDGATFLFTDTSTGKRIQHYDSDRTLETTVQLKKKLGDTRPLVLWGDNDRVGYYVSNPNGKEAYIISRKVV